MVLKVKSFSLPLTFYLLNWNYLLILKLLTETLFRIPFSVIGQCSLVSICQWLQGNAQELTCHMRLPIWFLRITAGFLQAFSVSKSPLLGLWSGLYWKGFQNWFVISKEQAKTWRLIFSSTKKQKIVKIIISAHGQKVKIIISAHGQKVPIYSVGSYDGSIRMGATLESWTPFFWLYNKPLKNSEKVLLSCPRTVSF